MAELEQEFVTSAPFSAERRLIFDAFAVWMSLLGGLLPGTRCWVDGGFVTKKAWAAPKDVDVSFLVKDSDANALTPHQQDTLLSLTTSHTASGARVQPMGGLVDGFMNLRSDPDMTAYWRQWWSQVRAADGSKVQNESKGFLEVIA